ncbi:diphosphomevalonate decarboxylase [Patescibacteria group bacterium]|nr:diphosphomevalonate decarboxylase [Patescibacteria group bacterium]MBU1877274.1 diphosphomevalonate decarboxylase [Patescibacteria group bacterium]
MKTTAIVNSNIALVKYWGKRDEKLILPNNSNISVAYDKLNTITTVEFNLDYSKDIFILDSNEITDGPVFKKTTEHLNIIRQKAGIETRAKVVSKNNFPTAAGLASSASGFSALAFAGSKAAGLNLDQRELSILARLSGSGSASRSLIGGFAEWMKGEKADGSDSYAIQIAKPDYWPEFRIIVAIISEARKKTSSTDGMNLTVKTCPLYQGWLNTIEQDLENVRKGIAEKNFTLIGSTAEFNCLKMHATMITTQPSLIYWMPETLEIIHSVLDWRKQGLEGYFTIDAGPQVKIICLEKDVEEINNKLCSIPSVKKTIICKVGKEAILTDNHLF